MLIVDELLNDLWPRLGNQWWAAETPITKSAMSNSPVARDAVDMAVFQADVNTISAPFTYRVLLGLIGAIKAPLVNICPLSLLMDGLPYVPMLCHITNLVNNLSPLKQGKSSSTFIAF